MGKVIIEHRGKAEACEDTDAIMTQVEKDVEWVHRRVRDLSRGGFKIDEEVTVAVDDPDVLGSRDYTIRAVLTRDE